MAEYRVGVTTNAVDLRRAVELSAPVLRYTMCRADAPSDWHSEIVRTFDATSWAEACRVFEMWVEAYARREER